MNKKILYNKIIGNLEPYPGKIYLVCCIGVEYDYDIVSHFIRYYKNLGVDEFLFVLNTEDENSENLKKVQKILRRYNIKEKKIWIGRYLADDQDYFTWKVRKDYVNENNDVYDDDWFVTVDIDEFVDFPVELRKFISYCNSMKYDFIIGEFIDRLTRTGEVSDIDENSNLWETFPIRTNMQYWNNTMYTKVVLVKSYVETTRGNHEAFTDNENIISSPKDYEGLTFPYKIDIDHFKWRGNLLKNHRKRAEFHKNLYIEFMSKKIIEIYSAYGTFFIDE